MTLVLGVLASIVLTVIIVKLLEPRVFSSYQVIEVQDITPAELFDFVTDLENDASWYPDIDGTDHIEDGADDLSGRRYAQYGNINGIPFRITIDILATSATATSRTMTFRGSGIGLWFHAQYVFETIEGGTRFINQSTVANPKLGYLFADPAAFFSVAKSEEALNTYTQGSFPRLLAALGKEGTYPPGIVRRIG